MSASLKLAGLLAVKSTPRAPGSACGQRCRISAGTDFESGLVAPPPAGTRTSDDPGLLTGWKTMMLSSPQPPPRAFDASASVTGAPPVTEIFLSLPPAKNAIH